MHASEHWLEWVDGIVSKYWAGIDGTVVFVRFVAPQSSVVIVDGRTWAGGYTGFVAFLD